MVLKTDGYIVPSTGTDRTVLGTTTRTHNGTPLGLTEDTYEAPQVLEPTSPPSVVIVQVDQPNNKTLKIVYNTSVKRGTGNVTVTDFTVVNTVVRDFIVYVTLNKPISEVDINGPRAPVSITIPAGFVWCTVDGEYTPSAAATPSVVYRYEYVLTVEPTLPAWAIAYHLFGVVKPKVQVNPVDNIDYSIPVIGNQNWYVLNNTGAEIPKTVDFVGRLIVGSEYIDIPCKLDSSSGEALKPNGMAKLTTLATSTNRWKCVTADTCTSGGGGVTTIIGTVLGGNSSTTRKAPVKAEDKVDPDVTSVLAYPVPYVNSSGTTSPTDVPVPNDWSKYVLPITWTVGNALPILPDGLCYVKLERPYTAYGASWDAVLPPSIIVATTGAPVPVSAITLGTALTTITIYMNRNISLVTPSTSRPTIVNLSVSTGAEVTPSGITVTANTIVLTVPALDIKYDYTISVPAGYVWTVEPLVNGEPVPPVQNSGFSLPITFKYPGAAVLICANRKGYQLFQAGDLVNLSLEGATIVDSLSAGQIVAEVLSPATNLKQPHIHGYGRFETGASSGTTLP